MDDKHPARHARNDTQTTLLRRPFKTSSSQSHRRKCATCSPRHEKKYMAPHSCPWGAQDRQHQETGATSNTWESYLKQHQGGSDSSKPCEPSTKPSHYTYNQHT